MPFAPSAALRRSGALILGVVVLALLSAVAGTSLARWLRGPVQALPTGDGRMPEHLFRGWTKPDLVLMLTGQQHGYLLPCGCSRPQVGGLERRYNFLQLLSERGWPTVAVDLGDVPQKHGPAGLPNVQGLLKYRYAMLAHKKMGYAVVGVGEYETALPLRDAVGAFALNDAPPELLCANLVDPIKVCADVVYPWKPVQARGSDLKVGVTALMGPDGQKSIKDPDVHFGRTPQVLPNVLRDMGKEKVDLRVLLYHGSAQRGEPGFQPQAVECAKAFPELNVILALSEEDEPSAEPKWVEHGPGKPKSMVVSLGHKGKYVGVVGVWKTGKADQPFELRYELVKMSEEFLTPADREADHPIVQLMEAYTKELKDPTDRAAKYLNRYPQSKHPLQIAVEGVAPKYVGTQRCGECHDHALKVWQKSAHSHAYQTLVDAKRPSLRQYDPECIVCHTVGFGYQTGFVDAEKSAKLKDVGCESCHGPGSAHVNDPANQQWRSLLNPWKAPPDERPEAKARRVLQIDQMCQRCHDIENDVTWVNNGFERKWPHIDHPTPE